LYDKKYLLNRTGLQKIAVIATTKVRLTHYCDRGPFQVIEFWVENVLMLELTTPVMTQTYLDFMHFDVYASCLDSAVSAA
jgi:hypothetical protein